MISEPVIVRKVKRTISSNNSSSLMIFQKIQTKAQKLERWLIYPFTIQPYYLRNKLQHLMTFKSVMNLLSVQEREPQQSLLLLLTCSLSLKIKTKHTQGAPVCICNHSSESRTITKIYNWKGNKTFKMEVIHHSAVDQKMRTLATTRECL